MEEEVFNNVTRRWVLPPTGCVIVCVRAVIMPRTERERERVYVCREVSGPVERRVVLRRVRAVSCGSRASGADPILSYSCAGCASRHVCK